MIISVIIYAQFLLWTVLYTVLCSPFFAVSVLTAKFFMPEKQAKVVRYFIIWYGKCIIRIALFPYVRLIYKRFVCSAI